MSNRQLPVRPNLEQLKHQAKDLLRSIRAGDPEAAALFREHLPSLADPAQARLADAQRVLARSYEAANWTRLTQAVQLVDAIWRDDIDTVRRLVTTNPKLIHEDALIRKNSNWGPPMTYAANVGRDDIIRMLRSLGASDLESAMGRAVLQGKIETAKMLHEMLGKTLPPDGALGGPAYTLSVEGTELVLKLGARVRDESGKLLAPVEVVLETDSRKPKAKHAILELYAQHGVIFPDTPPMALHRGRIDLLEAHIRREPGVLNRTFTHREIYPAEMGCRDEINATVGTPLGGTTLLHMCMDYDEQEIARWLIDHGADVNARSAIDKDGFGGYTPLFATVVSQANYWMNRRNLGVAPMAELLLEHGADVNIRASLWKQLHPGYGDDPGHEYRDVTALSWGRRFHGPLFVNRRALELIEVAGGIE
jgi:ankyrin repeat protein